MIDTHCHLSKKFYKNINEIVNHMDGIMIISGCNMESNKEVLKIVNNYKNVYGTLGIHPSEIQDFKQESLDFIEKNLTNKKIVAIGEIGLDYHFEKDNKDLQKKWFINQIKLANKYNKPIVVHSRDAINDTYKILKQESKTKKVLHCYSSSLEMAYEFIKLNCLLGIGGVITFKNNEKLKKVVKNIDLKYLLLETDSPYMAPVPLRGTINEPCNIKYVAQKISEIKNISYSEVIKQTTNNAKKIFDLGDNNGKF